MYNQWQDQYGLIHSKIHPELTQSENTPLFSSASLLLMRLNGTPMIGMEYPRFGVFKNNGQFHTYPNGDDNRFSHDNMTGLYIARELGYLPEDYELPIARWDSYTREGAFERKYWLHPRDLIFYSALNNKFIGNALLWFLLVISLGSWFSEGTSGKCLWFYRFGVLTLSNSLYKRSIGKVGLWLGELCMKREHGAEAFIDVFNNYFKDPQHPINQEIVKYYGNRR